MWTVEGTGGGCTADVLRVTDDRTGGEVAVVVTDGNLTALSLSGLTAPVLSVGVYAAEAWWGDADEREALGTAWEEEWTPEDVAGVLLGALGDAGVCLPDAEALGWAEKAARALLAPPTLRIGGVYTEEQAARLSGLGGEGL